MAPRLRTEGWRIEIEPGFAPPLAEADGDVDAILHEGSGIDWFEFDVGVSVDGQRINVLPQIIDLLKAAPDDADSDFFDLEDGDQQTLFVALDDGRLLPLPYARVKPILAALHELFRVDLTVNGEKLGFNRAAPPNSLLWKSGSPAPESPGRAVKRCAFWGNGCERRGLHRTPRSRRLRRDAPAVSGPRVFLDAFPR